MSSLTDSTYRERMLARREALRLQTAEVNASVSRTLAMADSASAANAELLIRLVTVTEEIRAYTADLRANS